MERFRRLGITEHIIKTIEEQGFEAPSEIQEKAIPLVLEGKDVIAKSATGSGKTLVFGSRLIQHCERGKGLQALVLTPTRELAQQVTDAIRGFSKHKQLRIIAVYGGVSIGPQIDQLKTADITVGTPGRIIDHIQRGTIKLGNVKILVLDEADRMLDMGFIEDVEAIIRRCPEQRQTLLFSATIPDDIKQLASKHMKNPIRISAASYVDPQKLKQVYYDIQENMKFSLLVHLLKKEKTGLVMIFCNSRNTVDFVQKNLKYAGIDAHALHGGFSQGKRSRTMISFHTKESQVLVCTDVASRGLDIPGVSHIYNYDIPKESKQYIHRIGRTARAGEEGKAVNLLSEKDHDNFRRIQGDYHITITKEERPYIERIEIRRSERPRFADNRRGRFHEGRSNERRRF